MKTSLLLLATASVLAYGALASAAPSLWSVGEGGNQHRYEAIYVPERICWDQAALLAESMTFRGVPGHLLTINSAAEQAWVRASFPGTNHFWIGGFQDSQSPEPDGGWRWVTGEPWTYTNWAAGEPNDSSQNEDGNENRLQFSQDGHGWNDLWPSASVPGFVVEFDVEIVETGARSIAGIKVRY